MLLALCVVASLTMGLIAALKSQSAIAGEADIIEATITALGDHRYRISATVLHADTGWDHYADRWDVLAMDGTLLGSRTLHHPHVEEQPFTRSLTLTLPPGTERIIIQAHDSVDGLGGSQLEIDVPDSDG